MANILHSRDKPDPGFNPTSKTTCFRCMEHGDRYVYIQGNRKYACQRHFHEWERECMKSERHKLAVFGED